MIGCGISRPWMLVPGQEHHKRQRKSGKEREDEASSDEAMQWTNQERMLEQTKRVVLPEMRKADEIASLVGLPIQLMRQNLQEWHASGRIFAVEENGTEYFPLFALNPRAHYQPYPAVAEVLGILGALMSPWGMGGWFVGISSFLDDQRPQDLLAVDPAWVIDAAKDVAGECQRG